METSELVMDREQARKMFRDYRLHQHYAKPIDREIQRIYQLISQGKVVIRALDSIIKAGLGEDKLPKLAIVRAGAAFCWLAARDDGSARFQNAQWVQESHRRNYIDLPAGSLPGIAKSWHASFRSVVPLIPVNLRPKRALENYHILFEAEWHEQVPEDPMLLRRIGASDHWLVLAAWDLTPIERDVLAGHVLARNRLQ